MGDLFRQRAARLHRKLSYAAPEAYLFHIEAAFREAHRHDTNPPQYSTEDGSCTHPGCDGEDTCINQKKE